VDRISNLIDFRICIGENWVNMPFVLIFWIWFCAYLNCAGWVLSWLHQLNATGYTVVLALGLIATWVWNRRCKPATGLGIDLGKLRRRFRRGFPLAFLTLTLLAFIGGALHSAGNYDTLAYRTPRVLHWLAAGHWHWIHTEFQRLNTRMAGFEWLTAPLFLFTKTDRLVFLINIISFLLLPGRFFAVLTRLGVRPRAVWYWMWLFPAGYGYILQAGSVVNDMFGALMALAAFEFALRARREPRMDYVWTSMLAAGLMTAIKAFNIMLLLPWLAAALPALKVLFRRPLVSGAVILFAACSSLAPTAVINYKQCGDWTGVKAEGNSIGGEGRPYRLLANTASLALGNIVPPIFPFTRQWEALVEKVIPPHLSEELHANMEPGLSDFAVPEMQVEESAGMGLGLTLLVLAALVKNVRVGNIWPARIFSIEIFVSLAAWGAIGVFSLQVGSAGPSRYLLPFYPFLIAPILAGAGAGNLFRSGYWRIAALCTFVVSAGLLVLSPPRPLWPAETVLRSLDAEHSNSFLMKRAWSVYSAYAVRADGFAPIIAKLPADANPLGLLAFDEPETGLWRPFGSRQIEHFTHTDSPADLEARGIKVALVSEYTLTHQCNMQPADWLARMNPETVEHFELKLLARQEPHGWLLVRFR
jgi:hypothetical protein